MGELLLLMSRHDLVLDPASDTNTGFSTTRISLKTLSIRVLATSETTCLEVGQRALRAGFATLLTNTSMPYLTRALNTL